jgi:hypothetical protein
MGVATDGERFYVMGGWTPSGATDEVWIGAFGSDGVPTFDDGPPLPAAVEHAASGLAGGRLWSVGGDDTSGALLDAVFTAPLTEDGVGDWVSAEPLAEAVTFATGASDGDHLYVIGGLPSFYGAARSDVLRLDPGPAGDYALVPQTPLPEDRFAAGATVADGYLYVAGGAPSFGADADTVWRAPIDAGTLGAWEEVGTLDQGLVTPAIAVRDGLVLVAGGLSGWAEAERKVWALDPASGDVTRLTRLPDARLGHGSVVVGERFVLIGGWESWQGGQMHETALVAAFCGG